MKCNKCNSEVKEGNKYCQNCGNSLLENNNNSLNNVTNDNTNLKIIKNFNKICSAFYFLAVLGIIIFIIRLLFTESYFFTLIMFGVLIVGGLFYLYNVLLMNYKNIKLINIEEQKLVNGLELGCTGFVSFATIYAIIASKDYDILAILLTIVCLIFFVISIKKIKLMKKIENNEREKVSYKKQNIILTVILGIMLFLIPIVTPINGCNKKYELNKNQLNKELKTYDIVSVNTVDYDASGSLSCRSSETQTIIGFKDRYNNYIKTDVTDSEKGNLRKDLTLPNVANIQFVNNILKNKYIKIVYDTEVYVKYSLKLDDNYLTNLFNSNILLFDESDEDKDIISEYDIKEKDYKFYLYLYKKENVSVSLETVKDYINNYVNGIIEIIGGEHIKEISVKVDDGYYILTYLNGEIIWEISNN